MPVQTPLALGGGQAELEVPEQFRLLGAGAPQTQGVADQGVIDHVEPGALFLGAFGQVIDDSRNRRTAAVSWSNVSRICPAITGS